MSCLPSYITAAFFVAVLCFDLLIGKWKHLPLHATLGIILTCLFWFICETLGPEISGAILLIPAVVVILYIARESFDHLSSNSISIDTCNRPKCPPPKCAPPPPSCTPPPAACPPPAPANCCSPRRRWQW